MAETVEPLALPEQLPSGQRVNILLVDDQPANLLVLEAILGELGHNLVTARSGEEALQRLLDDEFAVVLLDVQMPGLDGFETAKLIRGREESRRIPIIFLTGYDTDRFPVEQAYALGAVDYLVKPLVPVILRAKVAGFAELFQKTQQVNRQAERLRQVERREFEAKLAEENAALREAERRFKAVFNQQFQFMAILAPDGTVLEANETCFRATGVERERVLGRPFWETPWWDRLPAMQEQWKRHISEAVRGGGPVTGEMAYLLADGTIRYASTVVTGLKDECGRVTSIVVEGQDDTERKQNEATLRESEEKLRLLADSIPQLAWMAQPDGHIFWYNRRWYEYTGTTLEQMEGWGWQSVHDPDELPKVLECWKASIATGEPFDMVFPLRGKDSVFRPFLTRVMPVMNDEGRVARWFGTNTDISEAKNAEDRLREGRERLDFALAAADLGQWDLSLADGTSQRTLRHDQIFGYDTPLPEWTYEMFLEHVVPEDRPWVDAQFKETLATGTAWNVECRIRRADGAERWIWTKARIQRDAHERVERLLGVVGDITDRKGAEVVARKNLEVLKLAQNAGRIGHWEWNALTDENKWSPEIEALYGLPPGGFEGGYQGWAKLVHPDDLARAEEDVRRALVTGEYFTEFRVVWPDGSIHWLETRANVFKDAEGRAVRIIGVNMDITERKRAEEALRESEGRFRSLTESAPVGIFQTDAKGNCLFVNEKWCKLAGMLPEAAQGQGWLNALHPEDRERVFQEWYTAAQSGREFACEYRFRTPEGIVVWLQGSAVALRTEAGEVVGYIGTITDLTERREAEEQVRFQAHLLDSVGQAAAVTDPDGKIIYWNRYAETLYGWSRAEALGRNIVEVVVAPAAAEQAAEIMERLRSGERWAGEFLVRRRDGATFSAFVTDTPIFDGQGQLQAIIGISADITERKRVEQALRYLADASATLAAVVDYESTLQKVAGLAVPHFADWCAVDMVEADDSLRRLAVVHADSAKVKLAHEIQQRYPPDPDSPHGLPQVMRTGEPDMMTDIPDALLVQGARDEEHLRLLRELGLKSYMCVPLKGRGRLLGAVTFVSAESGRRYTASDLAFAEELARRAAIAIENAQLYAELRQADRLKDEFLAMLAHELRNPLAPVRNALHIMKQPGANGAMLQQVRDMAERQVQHMARLLDDLLDVSRISRGRIELRKEAVDVAAVISRTVEAVRPLVEERRHELTVSLPAGPLRVEADPTRLEQVLTNLVNNAAKYTDPRGHIGMTAERVGGEVVLRVRDTGIGIAPDMLPRIFDLFVQAERRLDRSQGGVGIGLTLVKKLVELHGGRIEATSAGLGRGSEFVVHLPALPEQHPGEKARPSGKEDVAELPRRRVLVVDDNQDAADSLAMLLRLAGQDVQAAYDGSSALTQAKDFQPAMVFLDIGMPGMDGYEVARRLRDEPGLPGVVLVALTGWGQEEDRRRSKEAGFDHHMVKPIEPAALENLLAGLRNLP